MSAIMPTILAVAALGVVYLLPSQPELAVHVSEPVATTEIGIPPPAEVVKQMSKAFHSAPVLHVMIHDRHMGVDYQCEGWLSGKRRLGRTVKDGRLIFAKYSDPDSGRVQEFVPEAAFPNKSTASSVCLEYDYDPNGGGWDHLVDYDLSCGPASVAIIDYLWGPQAPSGAVAESFETNMESAAASKAILNGHHCYRYLLDDIDGLMLIKWELYVDTTTYEPVRLYRRLTNVDKVTKEDTYDYTFEHLPNDNGIHWGLEVEKLKAEAAGAKKEADSPKK